MRSAGCSFYDGLNAELQMVCSACDRSSLYEGQPNFDIEQAVDFDKRGRYFSRTPIFVVPSPPNISTDIPVRIADLFREASKARRMNLFEAAGAMFRKTVDVATKHIYATDSRLQGKNPADAPRSRIRALGEMRILDADIVELADVAVLDGNDAAHDVDPYTAEEAEALEDLTTDLLDRLFMRPAKLAAVKAKQIAAGQRKA
ncbi:DUF4145 domain-containing protein [Nitratireductor soli]|uniref:DUF4145 domain-containing protein n=1 Tax=Nitratireductor soli TaxID=1670619 RepID=UPI001FCCDCDE|nr:DUF4145 domain-containing protein [Nitratireductor soli]